MSRSNTLLSYIIESTQPKHFGVSAEPISAPEWGDDSKTWDQVFTLAARLNVSLPLIVGINQCDWKKNYSTNFQIQIDQRLKNELIELAVLENEYENIIAELIRDHVTMVLLSGSVLQREMSLDQIFTSSKQLELLVSKDQINTALRVMGRLGYRVDTDSTEGGIALTRRLMSQVSGARVTAPIRVRWRILDVDADHQAAGLWERSVAKSSPEFPSGIRELAIEDRLAQLIRHAVIEKGLRSLMPFHQLDYWIRKEEQAGRTIDWAKFIFAVENVHAQCAAALALQWLTRYWQSPVPTNAVESAVGRLGPIKRRALLDDEEWQQWFLERPTGWIHELRAQMLFRDHPADALKASLWGRRRPEVA